MKYIEKLAVNTLVNNNIYILKFLFTVLSVGIMVFFGQGLSTFTIQAQTTNYALRFYGNGVNDIDRIKIRVADPETKANIGATDFTIEWWMNASQANNSGTVNCNGGGAGWITGNIIFDRDIWGTLQNGDFGISLHNGRIAMGVEKPASGITVCGSRLVADGNWHHIAVTRQTNGQIRIFVDGVLDASGMGPSGNVSYLNGRSTNYPNSDPFLVIGAEKHDAGNQYPSYNGILDEVRISNIARYTQNFSLPTAAFVSDANTVLLYHFDEGSGTSALDSSSTPLNGVIRRGGNPSGPTYITSTAPISGGTQTPTPTATPTPTPSSTPIPTSTATPVPEVCTADIDQDGFVDLSDYSVLVANFLKTVPANARADINKDGVVDISDYSILVKHFFESCN